MGESKVTQYVAEKYSSKMKDDTRKAFRVDQHHDEVKDWLAKKGITIPKGKPVVILWSRFSGKSGAAHPEHDTSYEGMRQIIRKIPKDHTIIIAGDGYPKRTGKEERAGEEGRNKYNDMVKEASERKFGDDSKTVINLTNIWEERGVDSWANKRVEQLRLYDYINQQANEKLIHIGPRSGNLEAMALIGHKVYYLEEHHAIGASRMASWAENGELTYKRILLDKPPTVSGKIVKAGIDGDRKDQLASDRQKEADKLEKKIKQAEDQRQKEFEKTGTDLEHYQEKEGYKDFLAFKGLPKDQKKGIKLDQTLQPYAKIDRYTQSIDADVDKKEKLESEIKILGTSEASFKEITDSLGISDQKVENINVKRELLSPSFLRLPRLRRHSDKAKFQLAKGFTKHDLDQIGSACLQI